MQRIMTRLLSTGPCEASSVPLLVPVFEVSSFEARPPQPCPGSHEPPSMWPCAPRWFHVDDGSLTLTAKNAKPLVFWQNDAADGPDIPA